VELSSRAASILVFGLAGCTGEASFELPSVDAGAPSARYESVCAAWAKRECAYEDTCTVSLLSRWEDDDQCVERNTLSCELQAGDPDVSFDPSLVGSCTFPPDCSGAIGVSSAPYSPTLCLPPGKAPRDAPCVWDSACQSGECQYTYGFDGEEATCGTCQPPASCGCTLGQVCVEGFDGGLSCVTPPDAGEACGKPNFLCNGSVCVPTGSGQDGTCEVVPEAGIGMPCSKDVTGPECASATSLVYCDATDHCRASAAADYGDACTLSTGGEGNVCVGAGWCDADNTGICQPPVPDGEPCDGQALPCLPPARCFEGECVFPSLSTCSR
jgi:hypothetical protein